MLLLFHRHLISGLIIHVKKGYPVHMGLVGLLVKFLVGLYSIKAPSLIALMH
jgi:hypothetical protein